MAALPQYLEPFLHIWIVRDRLVISRCSECGIVVAASPNEQVLAIVERLHSCPVYRNFARV